METMTQLAFSKIELGDYINEQMETVEDEDEVDSEIQIFQNALEFTAVKAREVMVPRTEITWRLSYMRTPRISDKTIYRDRLFQNTWYIKVQLTISLDMYIPMNYLKSLKP